MARKQLGSPPVTADDAVDKRTHDLKYSKPPGGIPATDLATGAVTVDKIGAAGIPGATTYLRGDGRWSVLVGNSILIEPEEDYILETPVQPSDGEMILYEIRPPTSQITVTVPTGIALTAGLSREIDVGALNSVFVGIRWSEPSQKWYLLAVTKEV